MGGTFVAYLRETNDIFPNNHTEHSSCPWVFLLILIVLLLCLGVLTTFKDGKLTSEVHPTVDPPTWNAYYNEFAKALNGEGDVPVSATDARSIIRLVELAKESSALGKTMDVN